MERFYENLWFKKMSKAKALREAQLWMLKEGATRGVVRLPEDAKDKKAKRVPPFYWAPSSSAATGGNRSANNLRGTT